MSETLSEDILGWIDPGGGLVDHPRERDLRTWAAGIAKLEAEVKRQRKALAWLAMETAWQRVDLTLAPDELMKAALAAAQEAGDG